MGLVAGLSEAAAWRGRESATSSSAALRRGVRRLGRGGAALMLAWVDIALMGWRVRANYE